MLQEYHPIRPQSTCSPIAAPLLFGVIWSAATCRRFRQFMARLNQKAATSRRTPKRRSSQHKPIHQILKRLLPAALVGRDVALGEHVFFEGLEVVLAGFNLGADAGGPGDVAVAEPAVEFVGGVDRLRRSER